MKLIICILFVSGIVFGQCAAPCLVHTQLVNSNGPTAGIDSTGATILIVSVNNISGSAATMTDSKGNSWHCLTRQPGDDIASSSTQICYAYDHGGSALSVGAAHTFTATTGTMKVFNVAVFNGTATGVDPFGVQNGSGIANSGDPGSITPTARSLVVTAYDQLFGASCTVSAPYAITDCLAAGSYGGGLAFAVNAAGTATHPTWTTGNHQSAAIASFSGVSAKKQWGRIIN